jgi:DNA repair photolyase
VCRDFRNPVGIVTKSYLVVRDIDVLQELNARTRANVYLSIPFADDAQARKIEVGAPPPSRRFEAMRRLHEAGIPVGLMLAPIIPGLNDRDIPTLLGRAAECGAYTAGYVPLRLPGSVKEVFLTRMGRALPLAAKRVESRIRDLRGGALNDPRFGARMDGRGEYWESVRRLFETTAARYGLNAHDECRSSEALGPSQPSPNQMTLF